MRFGREYNNIKHLNETLCSDIIKATNCLSLQKIFIQMNHFLFFNPTVLPAVFSYYIYIYPQLYHLMINENESYCKTASETLHPRRIPSPVETCLLYFSLK